MDEYARWPILVAVGLVVLVGAAAIAGLYFFAIRHRRDEEAAALQQSLMEPLAREPALAGSGVRLEVSWPWHHRPRVELMGWVESREMREVAVRAVEREAGKLGRRVRIVDSLDIVERREQRGA